jgi:RND family efflux transporter MFP subunit
LDQSSTLLRATRTIPGLPARVASLCAVLLATFLAGCQRDAGDAEALPPIRPVRVVTVEKLPGGETVTLTGTVQAKEDVSLSFRTGGQLIERLVNVGDTVEAGQVVARLDSEIEAQAVLAARANLAGARAQLADARSTVERYEPMVARGFVARQQFDRAVETRNAAQAQVDALAAQVASAENQLSFTTLVADGPGVVTARGAEPGEVVRAGQMIVQLAREGGRDAVFDVPSRVLESADPDDYVVVALSTDPAVTTKGRVREVAPQADPVTRTFPVRVGLTAPPPSMRLGSTVTGTVQLGGVPGIAIPSSALTSAQGNSAVWVLDPRDNRVALRSVDVIRYELNRVVVGGGLSPGEIVVTAGVQVLRPGQQVRLLGDQPGSPQSALPPVEVKLGPDGAPGVAPAGTPGQGAAK